MYACERNTVDVGVLYSHGCCWVWVFLAHNNGETLEGLIFLRIVMCRPIWTKLRGWGPGEGWALSGPTGGLWVTVVSGAAAVGRDGNPGRPPRRGTKQTNGLRGLRSVAQWRRMAGLKQVFHSSVQAACRNRGCAPNLASAPCDFT